MDWFSADHSAPVHSPRSHFISSPTSAASVCQSDHWFSFIVHAAVCLSDGSRWAHRDSAGTLDHRSACRGIPGLRSEKHRRELRRLRSTRRPRPRVLQALTLRSHSDRICRVQGSALTARSRLDRLEESAASAPRTPRLKSCFEELSSDCDRISCTAKLDYRAGASGRLQSKITSVEEKLGRSLRT